MTFFSGYTRSQVGANLSNLKNFIGRGVLFRKLKSGRYTRGALYIEGVGRTGRSVMTYNILKIKIVVLFYNLKYH